MALGVLEEETPLLPAKGSTSSVSSKASSLTSDKAAKYPRSVAFIISNEFCERFNYYGMRTILVLYLKDKLMYSPDAATVLYHIFTSMVYLFPIIGAILADSWMGRFRTILYLSIVYSIGGIVIAMGAVPTLALPVKEVTVLGLALIAMGTGGIKPCVSAFGGDQFRIPEQAKQLATFFSLFYFAINAGSLLSTAITPILREEHCFGQSDCYSLAFGVPAILMVVSLLIFAAGKSLYVMKPSSGNMIIGVFSCIAEAIKSRDSKNPRSHWLDHAEAKCGKKLVADTKALLKILVLYLPLPVFWALFDQQGSRWTFQANRMVGAIGSFSIRPDQMQVINPLLILVFIPIFNYAVYPLLEMIGIKRPLQKITLGGLLAAAAFMLSSLVELRLEQTYPELPGPTIGQLRLFNGMPCSYEFSTPIPTHTEIKMGPMSVFEEKHFVLHEAQRFVVDAESDNDELCPNITTTIEVKPGHALSYFLMRDDEQATVFNYIESPEKPSDRSPLLRVLSNVPADVDQLTLTGFGGKVQANGTDLFKLDPGMYELSFGSNTFGKVDIRLGGVYVLMVQGSVTTGYLYHLHELVEPNSVHMLWQLPQYIVMTAGEIMFSVTGLEFSFTQAPSSMKSVLQACWLLTVAIGNMLVVVIAELKIFKSQAAEFSLFAVLMVLDMAIFILLSLRYTYVEHSEEENPATNMNMAETPPKGRANDAFVNDV